MARLKNKNPKKQQNSTKNMMLATILVSVLISMLITLTVSALLFGYIGKREDPNSVSKISYLIQEAIGQLNEPTPIASFSDKLFIDDAKITFTRSNVVSLVHFYESSNENGQETVFLSDGRKISTSAAKMVNYNSVEESLEQVPYLQRCARQFAITFSNDTPQYGYAYDQTTQKPLKDGRVAYVWKINEPACSSSDYYPYDTDLLDVIESVESY